MRTVWSKKIDASSRGQYHDLCSYYPPNQRPAVFYPLPFAKCPPGLMAYRKVVLRKGVAFVPGEELLDVLCRGFKKQLEEALERAPLSAELASRDPRIGPLLKEMTNISWSGPVVTDVVGEEERLTLANWSHSYQRSFPPCARVMVDQMLRNRKHLKYKGRVQLSAFLKGAGFTLEESTQWWKQAMSQDPSFDMSKFDKEYLYGIRYTYGKVGNMKEKSAAKCQFNITANFPTGDEVHGCPFRHMDKEHLQNLLGGWGVGRSDLDGIIAKASDHHYELACRDYFKAKHPGNDGEDMGNHPLQYYQESAKYHVAKDKASKTPAASQAKN